MDFFISIKFYIYLLLILASMFVLNYIEYKYKRNTLLFFSLLMIIIFIGPIPGLLSVLLYLLYEYFLINIAFHLKRKYGMYYKGYYFIIFLTTIPFLMLKFKPIYNNFALVIIGLSYMTLKNIEILIENNEGNLVEVLPLDYLTIMLFFPSLVAGPIESTNRFRVQINKIQSKSAYIRLASSGIVKLIIGIFLKFVITDFLYIKLTGLKESNILVYAMINFLYIYFDVCSYSFLAVGTSNILGVKLPDNVQFALLSKSPLEFWSKFLITIISWFKKYPFNKFKEMLNEMNFIKKDYVKTIINIVLVFLLIGLWHGFKLNFIIFGLYNGLISSLGYYYYKKSNIYKLIKDIKFHNALAIIINFILLSFGFLILTGRQF